MPVKNNIVFFNYPTLKFLNGLGSPVEELNLGFRLFKL